MARVDIGVLCVCVCLLWVYSTHKYAHLTQKGQENNVLFLMSFSQNLSSLGQEIVIDKGMIGIICKNIKKVLR